MLSTKNLNITNVTKNSVNSKPLNNSKSSLNDQQNLGSNLQRIRTEININLIRNKFDFHQK